MANCNTTAPPLRGRFPTPMHAFSARQNVMWPCTWREEIARDCQNCHNCQKCQNFKSKIQIQTQSQNLTTETRRHGEEQDREQVTGNSRNRTAHETPKIPRSPAYARSSDSYG